MTFRKNGCFVLFEFSQYLGNVKNLNNVITKYYIKCIVKF